MTINNNDSSDLKKNRNKRKLNQRRCLSSENQETILTLLQKLL